MELYIKYKLTIDKQDERMKEKKSNMEKGKENMLVKHSNI